MVLPSRMEPFGIVLIEAMACKKPVVASAVGGIPEIIEHEVTGILVEPENPQALTAGLRRVLRIRSEEQHCRERLFQSDGALLFLSQRSGVRCRLLPHYWSR